jgi:hypothetical protein
VAAVQVVRIAQFAARGRVRDAGSGAWVERDFGVGHTEEFAGTEVGPLLGLSPGSADRRIEVAAVLARKRPGTLAAKAAGRLDLWRAGVIAEELRDTAPQACAAVEELIFPEVCGDPPRAARARVRRALLRVDPDGLRNKAAKTRLERGVRQWASDLPGMTEWAVTLPAADAATCWAAIDALAHRRHADSGPETTRGGGSEDVWEPGPWEDGGATDAEWAEVIELFAVDDTWADRPPETPPDTDTDADTDADDHSAGGVVAGVDRGCAGGPGGSGYPQRGPAGGGMLHPAHETTTPAAPLTADTPAWLRADPAGCLIPGIGVIPANSSTVADLHCLCKHHHRAKHQAGWHLAMTPDGTCTRTSPAGQDYPTHPTNHLQASA